MRATPTGYPDTVRPDRYQSERTDTTFDTRRGAFIRHVLANPGNGPYTELLRLEHGEAPDEARIRSAIEHVHERRDCADFRLNGLIPLMYRFGTSDRLSNETKNAIERAILGFKYWPDEPGEDSMCTWTENHQIMFAAAGYLAGQLYRETVFENSRLTGTEMMVRFRPRIDRWLELRFRSGFSEWLSHVYYNEDFPPLFNLIQYAEDDLLVGRACMVVDVMLLDLSINHFRGTLGSTHGRSYERGKKDGAAEGTGSIMKLISGYNAYQHGNMSAINMVLTDRYRLPDVIEAIAIDSERPEMLNRQRMGIRVRDAKRWGLGFRSLEDGMVYLSFEAYLHPRTAGLTIRMFDAFGWWSNRFFKPIAAHRTLITIGHKTGLLRLLTRFCRKDLTRNTREEVNFVTYRTPDYMLSTAQDYRKGFGGDQQHIWQATLGQKAVVFTTHPARYEGDEASSSPNYWTGSGSLPRAVQIKNVAVIHYRINTRPGLYLTHRLEWTHVWFPVGEFDEIVEQDGWVFGRKGSGYLGLWSQHPYTWGTKDGVRTEIQVAGTSNVYICEMGREATDGNFAGFVHRLTQAPIRVGKSHVYYVSPSRGAICMGWRGVVKHGDTRVHVRNYPRYDNPYVQAGFSAERIEIEHGGHRLSLDWESGERRMSRTP